MKRIAKRKDLLAYLPKYEVVFSEVPCYSDWFSHNPLIIFFVAIPFAILLLFYHTGVSIIVVNMLLSISFIILFMFVLFVVLVMFEFFVVFVVFGFLNRVFNGSISNPGRKLSGFLGIELCAEL